MPPALPFEHCFAIRRHAFKMPLRHPTIRCRLMLYAQTAMAWFVNGATEDLPAARRCADIAQQSEQRLRWRDRPGACFMPAISVRHIVCAPPLPMKSKSVCLARHRHADAAHHCWWALRRPGCRYERFWYRYCCIRCTSVRQPPLQRGRAGVCKARRTLCRAARCCRQRQRSIRRCSFWWFSFSFNPIAEFTALIASAFSMSTPPPDLPCYAFDFPRQPVAAALSIADRYEEADEALLFATSSARYCHRRL